LAKSEASAKAEPPAATPAVKAGPAWGAADVQPTPENPVYFRWSQGYFPGAKPPLEWWEGTPRTRTAELRSEKSRDYVRLAEIVKAGGMVEVRISDGLWRIWPSI
jgi:hypothetical protein